MRWIFDAAVPVVRQSSERTPAVAILLRVCLVNYFERIDLFIEVRVGAVVSLLECQANELEQASGLHVCEQGYRVSEYSLDQALLTLKIREKVAHIVLSIAQTGVMFSWHAN